MRATLLLAGLLAAGCAADGPEPCELVMDACVPIRDEAPGCGMPLTAWIIDLDRNCRTEQLAIDCTTTGTLDIGCYRATTPTGDLLLWTPSGSWGSSLAEPPFVLTRCTDSERTAVFAAYSTLCAP